MSSQKLFDPSFFRRMARFVLSPRIRPNQGLSGRYQSGKKGSSIEFSDVKEYLPGDDIRRIDWNAYARTEKLFVKLFMDEREAHYHILLDTSRSMSIPRQKAIHSLQIAGMLAWLVLNSGDRIDITFLRKKCYTTKSYLGTASFYPLLKELESVEFNGDYKLYSSISSLSFHGNGTTFLISDFLEQWEKEELFLKEIKNTISLLANKRQALVLIQIASREEENPEQLFLEERTENLFHLMDSETNDKIKISPSKNLLKHYYNAKSSFEQQLALMASHCQAIYLKTISDEPLEKFLEQGLFKGLWKS